jgi:hypothetical protein
MVTGFEELTYSLSAFEKSRILPIVLKGWRDKEENHIVQMKDMIKGLNDYCIKFKITRPNSKIGKIYKVNGPRMRQIIHYLRVSGKAYNLVATSKGYFITNDEKQLRAFIKSCRERANSFNEVANAMETYNFERKPSRCCGRCDGVHDICVSDVICNKHNQTGCEVCWPKP